MDGGGATRRVRVWDPWVRIVHWLLVPLLAFSWWTATTGRLQWHFLSGYAILTLVLFRLGWGVVGSDTARFGRFLRGPAAAIAHLRGFARRSPDREVGHNAAGGWMVLGLLLLLLAQAGTGLFADTGYGDRGPLARVVDSGVSDRLTGIHHRVVIGILVAVALHVLAVLLYRVVRGHDLTRAMLTGVKTLPAEVATPRAAPAWRAALVFAVAVAVVLAIARMR